MIGDTAGGVSLSNSETITYPDERSISLPSTNVRRQVNAAFARGYARSCSGMRTHRWGPYSPFKMPRHGLCKMLPRHRLQKMPQHLSGPCTSTDASGPSKVRGLRYGPRKIPEKRSSGSKMHGHRSRPHKTPGHRTSLCKMPRHRRSCKPSVGAIRPGRK
jgi:hypothetical protein